MLHEYTKPQNSRNDKCIYYIMLLLWQAYGVKLFCSSFYLYALFSSSSCSRVFVCACMIWLCGNITLLQSIINSNQLITNVLKKLFGFARRDSITGILLCICLYLLQTLLFIMFVFCLWTSVPHVSCNRIVRWFADIDV